jgi:membrane protease YdiL (CAAX protease family)
MSSSALGLSIEKSQNQKTIAFAWLVMVFVSSVPDIVVHEFQGRGSAWLFRGKILLLALALLGSFAWPVVRRLRRFFLAFLALCAAEEVIDGISHSKGWSHFVAGSFVSGMNASQLLKLIVALSMAVVVLALTGSSRRSFLRFGTRDATAKPIWYLPIRRPIPYRRFGPPLALVIGTGTLAFVLLAGHPSTLALRNSLPLLPLVLLWSAVNAFSEEYSFRASFLATLRTAVGDRQSLLLSSFFFGVAHFYGIPYGILGVAMATALGYVLGRAMVETEGILWPCFIHFVQDVVILSFLAIGAVTPAGR